MARTAPDRPPTLLLIKLDFRPDAVSLDAWCHAQLGMIGRPGRDVSSMHPSMDHQGLHVYAENAPRGPLDIRIPIAGVQLLNSPLALTTLCGPSITPGLNPDPARLYSLTLAVTENVLLYLRFTETDLARTGVERLMHGLQDAIMNIAMPTTNLETLLYHRTDNTCPH